MDPSAPFTGDLRDTTNNGETQETCILRFGTLWKVKMGDNSFKQNTTLNIDAYFIIYEFTHMSSHIEKHTGDRRPFAPNYYEFTAT